MQLHIVGQYHMQNYIFSKILYPLGHHKHIDEGAVECGRYWTNIGSTFTCTLNDVVFAKESQYFVEK